MKLSVRIGAYLMIALMFITLGHNAIPHTHIEDSCNGHSEHEISHHHSGQHHHHSNEESKDCFDCQHHHHLCEHTNQNYTSSNDKLIHFSGENVILEVKNFDCNISAQTTTQSISFLDVRLDYKSLFLHAFSLRGPPHLG